MQINSLLSYFVLTLVFSFLIGLELKAYQTKFHPDSQKNSLGTTRTYTFIGMLGFILYKLDSTYFSIYISGFFAFTLLFAILYNKYIDEKISIILPLLPQDKNIPYLDISAYKIWLTVVVIAVVSYISYIV